MLTFLIGAIGDWDNMPTSRKIAIFICFILCLLHKCIVYGGGD